MNGYNYLLNKNRLKIKSMYFSFPVLKSQPLIRTLSLCAVAGAFFVPPKKGKAAMG
jgi:hypothetical protein